MMKKFMLTLLVLFMSATQAQAEDIEFYFNKFKDSGVDFEPDGRICEEVAAHALEKEFGADHDLIQSVEYSLGRLTVGQLDILVKNRLTGKVVLISEVKCWKNPKGGLKKAVSQRNRFENAIKNRTNQVIFENMSAAQLAVEDFQSPYIYRSISQKGGAEFGFDQELNLTLKELSQLRMRILKCQAFGECKRPTYSK